MSRRGIIAGGNWIVDRVKIVDSWPEEETLANILGQTTSNGGAAYNVLIDLAKLGAELPLEGIGMIGKDIDGEMVLRDCREHGIDSRLIRKSPDAPTSYTDVVTVQGTGKSTFFHQRGANALLGVEHFDFYGLRAKHFHLGYLLLLDRLDMPDPQFGTAAGRVLAAAREAGLRTSVDVVSENSDRFASVVCPTLREADICFLDEFEAEKTTGVQLRLGGKPSEPGLSSAIQQVLSLGVREWAILHTAEGVLARHAAGEMHWQGSVKMPADAIKGSAGAGDALAAGVLLGLHEGLQMPECLVLGVCAAAASLTDATASGGLLKLAECLELGKDLGFR